jgi:hypothetical protein
VFSIPEDVKLGQFEVDEMWTFVKKNTMLADHQWN